MRPEYRTAGAMAVATAVLALAACASVPRPDAEMAVAQSTLSQAQSARAEQYAPVELHNARTRFGWAQQAMAREDYALARRLAEEADADAKLALTKSEASRQEQAAAELRQGIDTLKQELDRRSPAS